MFFYLFLFFSLLFSDATNSKKTNFFDSTKFDMPDFKLEELIKIRPTKGEFNPSQIRTITKNQIDSIKNVAKDFIPTEVSALDIIVMETTEGTMKLKFLPDVAPKHCYNFKKLANSGYYDGTTFHRVIPNFMIQGGDLFSRDSNKNNDGTGSPGWNVEQEFNKTNHKRGVLSMARSGDPNSAGSQFFICVADAPWLDGQYTVFGEVIENIEVVDFIVSKPRDKRDNPLSPARIKKIRVIDGQEKTKEKSNVNFIVSADREDVNLGEHIKLTFDINIDKGYFIYSTDPDLSLSPTKINWTDTTLFADKSIFIEPTPKVKYDEAFDMDVSYHTESIKLEQYLEFSPNMENGIKKIDGTLFYQVCDIKNCVRKEDYFSIDINILDNQPRKEYLGIPLHLKNSDSGNILENAIDSGLISFIFLSLGMGFLALLTPCVFPMIPITVSFFTKQGEKENNNPLKSAIIYALGIIVIFTSLGLILAITLGASGANQIASNAYVNLFIALLFVFFALSLFGFYEIQAPASLRQFSLQNEQKAGVAGILFMALTFTLTSFTCTVQFVGLLLVAASQGSYLWPIIGMIIFSFAFSLPFFFLALFPQYLSKLPKSGQWMNSIKVTMGFLEIGAAMKFFSNVDLVWGIGFFTYNVVLISWAIISLLTGLYLLGFIRFPHDIKLSSIRPPRFIISILFLVFGLYLTNGLYAGKVHGLIESYLPPKHEEGWFENYQEALVAAKDPLNTKPIFIDFTGYTCTNCRWMEKNVFTDPLVEELFENFILVRLYTDAGPNHKEYQQMEIDRYGTSALPFYVVIDSNEKEISRFHGMDPDISKFVKFLEESILNK